eukprot:8435613-Karenia_brevis.AAC.1
MGPPPKANASAQTSTSSNMENHPPAPFKAPPAGRPPPVPQPLPAIAPPALAAHHNFYVGGPMPIPMPGNPLGPPPPQPGVAQ